MIIVGAFILAAFVIFFIAGLLGFLADASDKRKYETECAEKSPKAPRMDFDVFKELYLLNPDRWDLRCDYVAYMGRNYNYVYVYFSNYAELKKYKKYVNWLEEKRNEEIRNKRTLDLLRQIQGDIDEYRASAIEEMKKHLGEEFLSHDQT